VLVRDGQRVWHHVDRADLKMRNFKHGLSGSLPAIGWRCGPVVGGAYQLEGVGAQLLLPPSMATTSPSWDCPTACRCSPHIPARARNLAVVSTTQLSAADGPLLSGRGRIAGVMGWPSPSRARHGCTAIGCGCTASTGPTYPCRSAGAFCDSAAGVCRSWDSPRQRDGAHKEVALAVVDRSDATARRIGAVNTIVVASDGTLDRPQQRRLWFHGEPARVPSDANHDRVDGADPPRRRIAPIQRRPARLPCGAPSRWRRRIPAAATPAALSQNAPAAPTGYVGPVDAVQPQPIAVQPWRARLGDAASPSRQRCGHGHSAAGRPLRTVVSCSRRQDSVLAQDVQQRQQWQSQDGEVVAIDGGKQLGPHASS